MRAQRSWFPMRQVLQLTGMAALALSPRLAHPQGGAAKARSIFAVPEIPAASFLDDASLQVTRPGTMQDLASALINGIDRSGHVRQGVALEVAPLLMRGAGINLAAYRTRGGFMRANFRLSLATQRTAGDSGSTDISIGARTTVFDRRDFLQSPAFTRALADLLVRCRRDASPGNAPGAIDSAVVNGCVRDGKAPLIEAWDAPRWNASSLVLAAAYGLRLDQSLLARTRGLGGRAWMSYAHGVGRWAQLLSYGAAEYVRGSTSDSTYTAASVGAKALVGSQRFNGFYQNAWQWRARKANAPIDPNAGQWSAGFEFSAREGIWISSGFGGAYAEASAPDRIVMFANVRWGMASAARLSPRSP